MEVLFGIHAVEQALKSQGRAFEYVAFLRGRADARMQRLIDRCRDAGVPTRFESKDQLQRLAKSSAHQGVVAVAAARQYLELEDVLKAKRREKHFVLVIDGVEDPHNLGAILRTADAAGADGALIPERRAVGVTPTVLKASAGAAEWVPVAKITNVSRALEDLKKKGIWTVGMDERAEMAYDDVDYCTDFALVLGGEGKGLHAKVREHCDFLVSVPMTGKVPSLNVSVAAAVVMYEAARQRRHKGT